MAHLSFYVEVLRVHVRSFGNYSECLIKFIQISCGNSHNLVEIFRELHEYFGSSKNLKLLSKYLVVTEHFLNIQYLFSNKITRNRSKI